MKNKSLSIFLFCLAGMFLLFEKKFGIICGVLSSLTFITWGLIFLNERKKTYISLK